MQKKQKGSILAYALIILALMLSIVTSLSVSTVIEKKNASSTEFSTQAYQTADSGVQLGIKKINTALTAGSRKIEDAFGAVNCSAGKVSSNDSGLVGKYELTFLDTGGGPLNCSADVRNVATINSVGTYKNTVRALKVKVASEDAYTKLLMHADDAGAEFIDSSASAKTITRNGGGVTHSAGSPFASGKSASFDGSSYLSLSSSTDFDFAANEDFTIDFWEKNAAGGGRQHALSFGQSSAGNYNLDFDFNDSGKGIWVYWNSSGTNKLWAGITDDYTNGSWHHIALQRDAGTMKLYVDGHKVDSVGYGAPIIVSGAMTYYIGAYSGGGLFWKGYLDELRISKGVARWPGVDDFTPPTSPY